MQQGPRTYAETAEPIPGPSTARLGEAARRHGIYLVAGLIERDGHGLYNTSVLIDRSELHKGKPVKGLTVGKSHSGGRNNHGRTTSFFRGGGHKQSYRIVDFKRRKFDVAGTVERLEYDPNRTAFIALIRYEDGEQSYILAPQRLQAGARQPRRVAPVVPPEALP